MRLFRARGPRADFLPAARERARLANWSAALRADPAGAMGSFEGYGCGTNAERFPRPPFKTKLFTYGARGRTRTGTPCGGGF